MGFNRENYKRIKEEYDGKYLRAIDAARLRSEEVRASVEGIAEIDRALSATGFGIFEATLKNDRAALDAINAENAELRAKKAALLVAAGYPADYTEVKYECVKCGDTGAVGTSMCECMRKKLVAAGFESSGMSDLIARQSFENFDLSYYKNDAKAYEIMTKIYGILKRYAEDFDPNSSGNVALFGKTGLGKTHLSSAVAGKVIERGYDVYYTGATNMFADFEVKRFGSAASYGAEGDVDKYFLCDLLIIDDLGVEVNNQFTTSCLYDVINTRLNKRRATIISTNLSQDEFKKRYWDRITSRIVGEFAVLPFMGTDIRAQKLAVKK